MKRLCVFAHWDRDNIIDDYVIYYLKALKEVCDYIIFVSDTECSSEKIKGTVDAAIIGIHGEYDFGSYKRGFLYAKDHGFDFDELLLVNDSFYGPFYPLKNIFNKMDPVKCDFWGLTQNSYGIKYVDGEYKETFLPHIQSCFLLLKRSVFNSNCFKEFIDSIEHKDNKDEVVLNYEIGLSRLLWENGFKSALYINRYKHTVNPLAAKWRRLIKWYKFPFLKTSLVKRNIINGWESVIKDYPAELINNNAKRLLVAEPCLWNQLNTYRKIRYVILQNLPNECRMILIFLEKHSFKILNTLCFNKLKKF